MYFRNYGLQNTWLDKCLKSPVSEDTSKSKYGKRAENVFNINASTFTILIDHCKDN